jgi:hypothetical protein
VVDVVIDVEVVEEVVEVVDDAGAIGATDVVGDGAPPLAPVLPGGTVVVVVVTGTAVTVICCDADAAAY